MYINIVYCVEFEFAFESTEDEEEMKIVDSKHFPMTLQICFLISSQVNAIILRIPLASGHESDVQ